MTIDRTSTITHLPLDQQWILDATNNCRRYTIFENTVGLTEARQIRKTVLTRLAEAVQICEILGVEPDVGVTGILILARGRVWHVSQFMAVAPAPVIEAGRNVRRAVLESLNTNETIDFRLVSR